MRVIPAALFGVAVVGACVWSPHGLAAAAPGGSPLAEAALMRSLWAAVALAAPIVLAFSVFPGATLRSYLRKTPKSKSYGPSVLLTWFVVSHVASAEYVWLGAGPAWSAVFLAAQAVVAAQFTLFSRLSRSRLALPCLAICSFHVVAIPLVVSYPLWHPSPLWLLLPAAITLVAFRKGVPVLRSREWEHYAITVPAGVVVDGSTPRRIAAPLFRQCTDSEGGLRVVQITDTHIGPMTTEDELRAFCEEVVSVVKPDLVLITGDLLTTECYDDAKRYIVRSLMPLKAVADRVFFCYGNHDHEAFDEITAAIEELEFNILKDEATTVIIRGEAIQIIGIDYYKAGLKRQTQDDVSEIVRRCQPNGCQIRILLLHDPSSFEFVPKDSRAIVFSGHTHGGMVGIPGVFSVTHWVAGVPDNSCWGLGSNLLYVHRGQGSRSLLGNVLLRMGIPAEKSVVTIKQ